MRSLAKCFEMEESMKVLVVEDDNYINEMLKEALENKGYTVLRAYSGTEGLLRIETEEFALIILDLMLPGMSGQEVLQKARKITAAPVIVLSAKDELDTKVDLLTLGANDYMTKTFALKELEARMQVWLRMGSGTAAGKHLKHKELQMDLEGKQVTLKGEHIPLTVQEYKILELLLSHPHKVFSKNEIYQYAWEDYYEGEDKTLNVHISNIRQKLKKVTEQEYIETVWGIGFKLSE